MNNSKEEIRVLIVDDDDDDFLIISEYIKRIPASNFVTDWCPNYDQAIALMREAKYHVYLVDYRLGLHTGVEFLKQAQMVNCEEPIILLTGKGNIKVDIEAMQLGAVDYLIKSELSVDNIERSIRYALDRANAMKTIKANERKYRNIFEQSKDVIFIADEHFEIIDINEAANTLLGYDANLMIGQLFIELINQPLHQEHIRQNLLSGRDVADQEVFIKANDGDNKICTISIVIEKAAADERAIRYHGIIHDITNLKKVEKATLQVEKLATVGRFVRTLAHEVRNPLNNITLSVEQLKEEWKDESTALYFDIIQRNSKRISDLISELLHTSKPSETVLEQHILQTIVDDVIAKAIDRLTLKHMKLEIDFPEMQLYVAADRDKLCLALLNMIINAIEAMEENKGVLTLSIYKQNDHVLLEIADNGCGISEENITRLFEPYFTQKRNGMGLGLATTLNILQAHHAGIDVYSKEGEGSTFYISFPIFDTVLA